MQSEYPYPHSNSRCDFNETFVLVNKTIQGIAALSLCKALCSQEAGSCHLSFWNILSALFKTKVSVGGTFRMLWSVVDVVLCFSEFHMV